MNCLQHPDAAAAAYCQQCGKPLCAQCMRNADNMVQCDACIAGTSGAAQSGGAAGFPNVPPHIPVPYPGMHAKPALAFLLGIIPGVGAMYNGQFAKGLAHVVIFALLVDLSHWNGLLGLLIAAWVFYQMFDAYQTAVARRDGMPLPNPLGLNDIGQWFGPRHPVVTRPGSPIMPPPAPFTSAPPVDPIPSAPAVSPAEMPEPASVAWRGRGFPASAVVLIAIGIAFLLGNLGILRADWLAHGWPLIPIALGVWMILRRNTHLPRGGNQ